MQPVADPTNEEFGPYVVQERLGLGGMATVYRAKKRGIEGYERNVALKRMLSHLAEDSQFVESFIREAKVASLLVHPNIAQVYDFGRINGIYYIAMELVQGFDLRKLLRHANRTNEPIPLPVILSILVEMCDALDYAHTFVDEHGQALGIVHRDVSPSNLIVAHNGHVKMIDFGIAKAQSRQLKTESGQVKGKLGYMSPEAAMGVQIDAGSDVFSEGVVAWELITAQPLFSAKSDFETMRRIREEEVVPPSRYNPQCPRALDDLVLSATARDARYRLHSAGLFRQKLDEIASRAGIQINARSVAEWTAQFATPEQLVQHRARTPSQVSVSGNRPLPLQAQPDGPLTQNIRPSARAALVRTREETELATEIWGEDANTSHEPSAPGPDYSAMAPPRVLGTIGAGPPIPSIAGIASRPSELPASRPLGMVPPPVAPAAPPRRNRLALVLVALILVAGAGIAIVLWPKGDAAPAAPAASTASKPRSSLKFQLDPANAVVEIGGKPVAHTGPFEAPLDPGVYTVSVHADGYKKWTSPITLRDDEHQAIDIQLERQMAHLVVDSSPPGLAVQVDGKPVDQKTPARLDVTAGDHHVTVASAAGQRWESDVTAPADSTQNLTAAFAPLVGTAPVTPPPKHDHRHHDVANHDPEPVEPKPDPTVEPPKVDPPKVDPTPPRIDPPKVDPTPPKPTRVPVVPVTSVTKLAGELPTLKVHGNDTNGDVNAKMCIDETGRVTSVKMLKAPAEISSELQQALSGWRYKAMPNPVCFLLSLRVVVKHAD